MTSSPVGAQREPCERPGPKKMARSTTPKVLAVELESKTPETMGNPVSL